MGKKFTIGNKDYDIIVKNKHISKLKNLLKSIAVEQDKLLEGGMNFINSIEDVAKEITGITNADWDNLDSDDTEPVIDYIKKKVLAVADFTRN